LTAYCKALKSRFPDLQYIVGYATEPVDGERSSEDLVYVDATNWTEEDAQTARTIQREGGYWRRQGSLTFMNLNTRLHPARKFPIRRRCDTVEFVAVGGGHWEEG